MPDDQRLVKRPGAAGPPGIFGLVWLLGWSAITLAFDGLWLGMLAFQLATWTYAATGGTIRESRVEQQAGDDGPTYTAKIVYEYEAEGEKLRGTRIRYFDMRFASGKADAVRDTQRFPQGRAVTVYYRPGRPSQAVLDCAVRGGDFFLPLFMNPFNIIMLGGWYWYLSSWRRGGRPAGFHSRDDELKLVVRLYNVTPLTAAAVAVLISSFVLIFVCGFGMRAAPIDWLVIGAWCVVLGSAIAAWCVFRQPATTLEYDHFSGRIAIAKSDGQSHVFTTSDVVGLGVDTTLDEPECVDEDGGEEENVARVPGIDDNVVDARPEHADSSDSAATYSPVITYRDAQGNEQTVRLANWSSQDSVGWLVNRLGETLRLKA